MGVVDIRGVRYVDVRDGGFRTVAEMTAPGVTTVPVADLDRVLGERFTDVNQVRQAVVGDWKLNARGAGQRHLQPRQFRQPAATTAPPTAGF